MMMNWQLGSVLLSEYDDDGFLGIQIEAYGGDDSGLSTMEMLHPGGFIHRPRDPDEDGKATCLYFFQGDQPFAMVMNDPRPINDGQVPKVGKGDQILFAHRPKGLGRSYDHHVGDTGNKRIVVDYDGGTHEIIVHGDSAVIEIKTSGQAKVSAQGGAEINGATITPDGDVIDSTGVSLRNHLTPSPFGPLGPPTPTPSP